jgi:hypothetical protein
MHSNFRKLQETTTDGGTNTYSQLLQLRALQTPRRNGRLETCSVLLQCLRNARYMLLRQTERQQVVPHVRQLCATNSSQDRVITVAAEQWEEGHDAPYLGPFSQCSVHNGLQSSVHQAEFRDLRLNKPTINAIGPEQKASVC